ncbi:MAG: class I SAM-dependent methyltransferase [Euryarchaeota archaeon]|nr:class I SAM-dependent methyltransferase [Euryarchaeota archaeon]
MEMGVKDAYDDAISSGRYESVSGITGKYDNVRVLWEDEVTRALVRSCVQRLAQRKDKIRIMDMGCGYGDGYELLKGIREEDGVNCEYLITDEGTEYKGFDINASFIKEARGRYRGRENMSFEVANFSEGFPFKDDESYDIYFTSYGSLSHLGDEANAKLLADIAEHSSNNGNKSVVVCDWLGKYSYEWQNLWEDKDDLNIGEEEEWIDYRISYFGDKDVKSFPLRLMSKEEVEEVVKRANEISSARIRIEGFVDRSIFVGRHMETGDYNRYCMPLRRMVNSLFEINVVTDLEQLLIRYHKKKGESFEWLNSFFEEFCMRWNGVISYTNELLSGDSKGAEPLSEAEEKMCEIVDSNAWVENSNPRANLIEPQLGHLLRELEMGLQEGIGASHGFIAVLNVGQG